MFPYEDEPARLLSSESVQNTDGGPSLRMFSISRAIENLYKVCEEMVWKSQRIPKTITIDYHPALPILSAKGSFSCCSFLDHHIFPQRCT